MELTAVIEALAALKQRQPGRACYTDSEYVKNGITTWIHGWKARGWTTADRKPVKNVDLWQRLDALRGGHQVRLALGQGPCRRPRQRARRRAWPTAASAAGCADPAGVRRPSAPLPAGAAVASGYSRGLPGNGHA